MKKFMAFIIFFFATTASAYDPELAANNLAHEFASCGAFYILITEAPDLDQNLKEQYENMGMMMLFYSEKLSTEKLAMARAELEMEKMKRDLEGSWNNLSILLNEYAYKCKDLTEKPEERIKYWLDKEAK